MRRRGGTGVRWLGGIMLLALLGTGCFGPREAQERPPDERFGHRYEGYGPAGRLTTAIVPPDTATSYFFYSAVFDSVHVRPAPFGEVTPGTPAETPVEVLIKGSFPDACMELHDAEQERTGHLIDVTLTMRKPQGAVCDAVRRPYRFYLMLKGRYAPGHYTLTINDIEVPFAVRAPDQQAR